MEIIPITLREANRFVDMFHRHNNQEQETFIKKTLKVFIIFQRWLIAKRVCNNLYRPTF